MLNVAYGMLVERCRDEDERFELDCLVRPDPDADQTGYVADPFTRAERLAQSFHGDGELVIVDG